MLGSNGEGLIKSFETLRLTAYLDQGGVPTIGWGHTRGVQMGDTCTADQAESWFQQDVASAVHGVTITLSVPVNQNQFDALVSFTFNVGVGSEAHSTLLKDVNCEDWPGAANQFLVWNHVNGQVDAGLTRRREAERTLFLTAA